jgi:hypothetical protein
LFQNGLNLFRKTGDVLVYVAGLVFHPTFFVLKTVFSTK